MWIGLILVLLVAFLVVSPFAIRPFWRPGLWRPWRRPGPVVRGMRRRAIRRAMWRRF